MAAFSDQALIDAVRESFSVAGTIRLLGLSVVGSNYRLIKSCVQRLRLDTAHWVSSTPPGHPRNKAVASETLVVDSKRPRATIRKLVLREGLVPYVCADCGCSPVWNGKTLVLRLDHINGVNNDCRLLNLRFLCPNCDSQTSTYCGRNKKKVKHPVNACITCGTATATREATRCRPCAHRARPHRTKIVWPPIAELKSMLEAASFSAVARALGVSGTAVHKHWARQAGFEPAMGLRHGI